MADGFVVIDYWVEKSRRAWNTTFGHPSFNPLIHRRMFSHVVIFWTDPDKPDAAEELVAGAEKYLRPIPGVSSIHVGRMVKSHRDVVDQSYQVALNLQFANKQLQDQYQDHPLHLEFVEKVFKRNCRRAVIYDFE
jgi:hypothetical protein